MSEREVIPIRKGLKIEQDRQAELTTFINQQMATFVEEGYQPIEVVLLITSADGTYRRACDTQRVPISYLYAYAAKCLLEPVE